MTAGDGERGRVHVFNPAQVGAVVFWWPLDGWDPAAALWRAASLAAAKDAGASISSDLDPRDRSVDVNREDAS